MMPPPGSSPRKVDLDTSRWAVVIPSFNHADDAINCLASLREADGRPSHVILVDDASTDDAVGTISAWAAKAGVSYMQQFANWCLQNKGGPQRVPPVQQAARGPVQCGLDMQGH